MTDDTRKAQAGDATPDTPSKISDDVLLIIPVRNMVLFPGLVVPVAIGREASLAAAREAVRSERKVGFLLQKDPELEDPSDDDLHEVGTIASVMRFVSGPDGEHHLVCMGEERFEVLDYLPGHPYRVARVERMTDASAPDTELKARLHVLKKQALEAVSLFPQAPRELVNTIRGIDSAAALADFVANFLDVDVEEKQALLETGDVLERLDRVVELLGQRMEVLRLSNEIDQQARESMDERQREFMLREQLKTIQKELGEDDSGETADELAEKIDRAGMPEEVETHARKELKRLRAMPEAAAEFGMLSQYLETLVTLPWNALDEEDIDIAAAREVLDEDHYGLDKVKRRIVEYLAVRKLNPEGRSPILCFVGPPGVGKTSLGRSIARSLGLEFGRISLGGTHDEAEIRGHRRTYVGSMPGNIIQAISRAGTRNPVLMLDEMDKLGAGFHGDPSSALLEVLDPEQNATFRDNYLGVPFDLSKVLFVATANRLDTIPGPLRDRMEIIELPGYTEDEKVEIARRYLVGRQLKANGLDDTQASVSDEVLRAIVSDYTREAGCRNLERDIGAVLRHAAVRVTEGERDPIAIGPDDLHGILGAKRFDSEVALRTSVPGVATGLAWTPVGGDILFIEATRMPGNGRLILTGQLGDVMKESAQAALSLVKSRASDIGIDVESLSKSDIHVHVPAGAIPKDGPSAGVAMFVALVSLLTGRVVRNDVAMTGEISLRGLVLPIGGVK
ncbi:MAG: endopeptidase La, partial [Pseudomonadota bacterium]